MRNIYVAVAVEADLKMPYVVGAGFDLFNVHQLIMQRAEEFIDEAVEVDVDEGSEMIIDSPSVGNVVVRRDDNILLTIEVSSTQLCDQYQ